MIGKSEQQRRPAMITRVNIDNVVDWMAEHGRTCYVNMIEVVRCTMREIEAEAGRHGKFCEFTQKSLRQCREEIEEIKQSAWDRFEDWATD
jgi:hypothetical protein